MKKTIATLLLGTVITSGLLAADKVEREENLAKSIGELSIPDGIVDMYKDTNGQITIYIGGRGMASGNLTRLSGEVAQKHAFSLADTAASRAFSDFIQRNVEAILESQVNITDASLDVDAIMKKMASVTENEKLAKDLRPQDRAAIMKAVIDTIIDSIRNSTGFRNVTTEQVRQASRQKIRGMYLFGSHVGEKNGEIRAVKVFKWSPNSANLAAVAEGVNNQKATDPQKGAQKLMEGVKPGGVKEKPFISHADDF